MNQTAKAESAYDAIIIGSGISGGWAAKELCEKGLKTLVLERGRAVTHLKDYPTANLHPWEFPLRTRLPFAVEEANPVVGRCYAFNDTTKHFFVKDQEHPYIQEKPFDWIRGYQEGGKSLLWARQTQRWSRYEFEAPARDGFAVDWPIRYNDLEPWYSYVEKFVGISGNRDGIDNLPDSEVLPAWEMNCVEDHISKQIQSNFPGRHAIIGRCAHLTKPNDIHLQQGRNQCQARTLCERGCPFGGYFSSNSSTLPWARKTGNLTLRPFSVVHSILYDDKTNKAAGVRVIDAVTKEELEFKARVIFVNASTINTNLILLNSVTNRFPNGIGNDSGTLGHYLAFHNYRGSLTASFDGFEDQYYSGRRPTQVFIPAYTNVQKQDSPFLRGYMSYFGAYREGWWRHSDKIGTDWKKEVQEPGPWRISFGMQGETIPVYDNHVRLSKDQKDEWGIPQIITSVGYTENDDKMTKHFIEQSADMLDKAGCKDIKSNDNHQAPGLDIHEMGGCRMGKDPRTSMLNGWNQLHACKNVFVTDGACMTSVGNQNPSLTFMAITARAANHAVEELKRGNL